MKRKFTLMYWMEDGWYIGKIKEVPGVFSQGENLKELQENIQDAYTKMMEEYSEKSPPGKTKEILLKVA